MQTSESIPYPRPGEAYCLGCAYPVRHLDRSSGECPECGRSFDLEDPTTTTPTPRFSRFRRWLAGYQHKVLRPTPWLKPLSLMVQIVSIVLSILLLGDILIPIAVVVGGAVVILIAYTPRRIVRHGLGKTGHFPVKADEIDHRALVRLRKVTLWTVFFLLLRLPSNLAILTHLVVLNNVALRVDTNPAVEAQKTHCFIGMLPIRQRAIGHGGADFETFGGRTLLYRPAWNSNYYDEHVRHLVGHWFACDLPLRHCTSFGGVRSRYW